MSVCKLLCILRALESVEIILASRPNPLPVGAINVFELFPYRKKPAFEIPVGCLRTCTNDTSGLAALRDCDAIEQLPFRPLRISP